MLRFGINLLWVRPGKVGGTEFMTRNLLDGMILLQEDFEAVLIVSEDNADTFKHYSQDKRFKLVVAGIESANISKRIIWQNLHLAGFLKKNGLELCFSPVYDRPVMNFGIRYITTIHDIQAYHYPQYHPLHEVVYSKLLWLTDKWKSDFNVTISDYVAKDLVKVYHFNPKKMATIYNAVVLDKDEQTSFDILSKKYGIESKSYYYTVGQLIKHKNIPTLIKVMKKIIKEHSLERDYCHKLLITGINGNAADAIKKQIKEEGLEDVIELTGFIDTADRNTLYANAKAFLFPSVFEGFGIPPIEAMIMGTTVVTTKCACIPEVTQNVAEYVDDPYDADDWIKHMKNPVNNSAKIDQEVYDKRRIAKMYLSCLGRVWCKYK